MSTAQFLALRLMVNIDAARDLRTKRHLAQTGLAEQPTRLQTPGQEK